MKWVPPWLARAYARIYSEKRTAYFEFSEAARILQIKDERPLAKVLSKLKSSGYLTVKRDPVDPRRKLFRLSDPESVTLAFAIQSKAKSADLLEKLKAASQSLDYYVFGAYAAYQYHRHAASGSMDISVKPEHVATWVALLSERDVALSIDDVPSEKPAKVNVHIHSDFDGKLADNSKILNGIRYLLPEALVVTGFVSERPSLEDVLAILVAQRHKLNWEKLLALSDAYNANRYLGCVLDIMNFESEKSLFKADLIERILKVSNLEVRVDFPSRPRAEPVEESYAPISSKWNVRLHVGRAVFSKVIIDLVRT